MRLVAAELLKLRKRRSLALTVLGLTVGASIVTYGVLAILHSANPAHHGPAGGVTNLGHGMFVLGALGSVAATLVGATAGAGDLTAGVFRELVVTGRSRPALYRARIPGGLLFLLPFVVAGFTLAAVATVVFAGPLEQPSTRLLVESGLWQLLNASLYFVLALGLASLVGSRSITIGVLLAFRLAITPILLSIPSLGVGRDTVPGAALAHVAPKAIEEFLRQGGRVPMSHGAAVATLVAWAAVASALGAWRTSTRDA